MIWGIFLYFHTRVPTTKKITLSTFLNIAFFTVFRFLIAYLFLFIVVLLFFGCCNFDDIMKFEFNLFLQGEYFKILVYYFISIFLYIKQLPLIVLHFTGIFSIKFVSLYYISACFYHFYFTFSFYEN